MKKRLLLTDAQLAAEISRCVYCEEKPCREACPAHCSAADFLMAAKPGSPADYRRSAAAIMTMNPFGTVCGLVCPDHFCQAECSRKLFDRPIEIPAVQATIIEKARGLGVMPGLKPVRTNGRRAAVIGAGPAGLAAVLYLAQRGYEVHIMDRGRIGGGACNVIPERRLPRSVVKADVDFVLSLPNVTFLPRTEVQNPAELLSKSFEAVVVAVGLWEPIRLGIRSEDAAVRGLDYLRNPAKYKMNGAVAVVGGGATAVDCAVTAKKRGAERVEMFALEKLSEMPLTPKELAEVMAAGIHVNGRVRLTGITAGKGITGISTRKVSLPEGTKFHPGKVKDVPGTDQRRSDFRHLIVAIGARSGLQAQKRKGVFYAGDCSHGPSTVVEASASGKNAAIRVEAFLTGKVAPKIARPRKSYVLVPGYNKFPVPLETDFFGRRIHSPFLLSAAPPSDGYEQMKRGFDAGWAGGVMKTAFDNVPIHIPADYMIAFDQETWGNCDNVSGHQLVRVCREIERLVKEYPDRLIAASTGGPVTGDDESDCRGWQSNTRKLESAGVMAIEYSLSCPQGGDGTEGAIVSQNARLTAKIIDWVMQISDPNVPKLFKMTGAVTSVAVIVKAVREVLDHYPAKKAGVTLANTFPVMGFRPGTKMEWEEGVVYGMSGAGIAPISNLTLASVANLGVTVSGNGGTMDYKSAAHFLALGARTVQFCTAVMKYGYGYLDELNSGPSHMMAARGMKSVSDLIGCALPNPATDFMALSSKKRISSVDADLCMSCGNCTRCSYFAVTLDDDRHPVISAEHCIGCSICVQKCFSGALAMRDRTAKEASALREE
ncbi:MAG: FAD-dependent oxidoreductase [bacterium]